MKAIRIKMVVCLLAAVTAGMVHGDEGWPKGFVVEGPLPEGFPKPSPAGEVVRKTYPAFRVARASEKDGQRPDSFWRLFNHIKTNGIPMTAPVEQRMEEGKGQPGLVMASMGFLYDDPKRGETGRAPGEVDVIDEPSVEVLSLGFFGARTAERVREARDRLKAHADAEGIETSGWRVFGYNSPMVPEALRFWELQAIVKDPG